MHRSGTSALTACLRSMGLWAGEERDLTSADEHNEAGYWEHRGVSALDNAILESLGARWSDVAHLDLSRLSGDSLERFRHRARDIIGELDRHGSWVIKDPRLSVLFPIWRELLANPFCILMHRDPLAVARSLAARNGFPIPFGIALWEKYTLAALASTRGVPRLLVRLPELLAQPEAVLRQIHERLVSYEPELRIPPATEIDPALVHHSRDREQERRYLTPPQAELLELIENGSALDLDSLPPLSEGAQELLNGFENMLANRRLLLGWIEELDLLITGILGSRTWKAGRAITSAMRRILGGAKPDVSERRDQLRDEVRHWRQETDK